MVNTSIEQPLRPFVLAIMFATCKKTPTSYDNCSRLILSLYMHGRLVPSIEDEDQPYRSYCFTRALSQMGISNGHVCTAFSIGLCDTEKQQQHMASHVLRSTADCRRLAFLYQSINDGRCWKFTYALVDSPDHATRQKR